MGVDAAKDVPDGVEVCVPLGQVWGLGIAYDG